MKKLVMLSFLMLIFSCSTIENHFKNRNMYVHNENSKFITIFKNEDKKEVEKEHIIEIKEDKKEIKEDKKEIVIRNGNEEIRVEKKEETKKEEIKEEKIKEEEIKSMFSNEDLQIIKYISTKVIENEDTVKKMLESSLLNLNEKGIKISTLEFLAMADDIINKSNIKNFALISARVINRLENK